MDRCMARLQELQYTVLGGTKVISRVSLSPGSTRGYLRTSLGCKQETARIKGSAPRKSPGGKFPARAGGQSLWIHSSTIFWFVTLLKKPVALC